MSQVLVVSGALNILLLALFFYQWIQDKPSTTMEWKPAELSQQSDAHTPFNRQMLNEYENMQFQQLVANLRNKSSIGENYAQRDLALAYLITHHEFDIDRALASQPVQKQHVMVSSDPNGVGSKITMVAGLNDAQFEQIYHFATTERWPLTAKGLFLALKKSEAPVTENAVTAPESQAKDTSLVDAFYLTQEFQLVELLFKRSDVAIDREDILDVLKQGDWQTLSAFIEEQRQAQDLSAARRQKLLLDYVHQHSPAAALTMLKTDGAFAAHRLDDADTISVLDMLREKSSAAELFAVELLNSPRSQAVWEAAASRLYSYAGEVVPQPFNHKLAMSRFTPKEIGNKNIDVATTVRESKPRQTPAVKLESRPGARPLANNKPRPAIPANIIYKVQNGDSLWKVAKKFQVSVQAIKKCNSLQSDSIRPGQQLKIPRKEVVQPVNKAPGQNLRH